MNKNKGFTLTELLAVIAILTVLSLIVIPIVNDQVNISKQKSFDSTIDSVKRAVYYYMDQKELNGDNNEYIYNLDVEDLKVSNGETLKGKIIVTKTETGYDIKYLGISNGQFIYYGDSEKGTTYKESEIKKDSEINSSESTLFENADPILTSNNENIIIDDCYKNIIVKSNLTELEKSLSVLGGEFEIVPVEDVFYRYDKKVNLIKNEEIVDAYDVIIANGDVAMDTIVDGLDLSLTDYCRTPENMGYKIAKTCHENGLDKDEDLHCLYADFDYNRIITDDEYQKVLGYFHSATSCAIDSVTGLNSCDK